MNNLQQRFRKNNLMQQGQNMLAQQQNDFNTWYDAGSAIGGAFFPNMANGTSDGEYGGSIVGGVGKTDKENADIMGNLDNQSITNLSANNAIYDQIANNIDGLFTTDGNGGKILDSEAIKNGIFSGNNSYLSQGVNKMGYAGGSEGRQILGGALKWLQNNMKTLE